MAVQTCCCVSSAEAQLTHTSWVVLWSRSYKDLVCVQIKDLNLFIYQNSLICRVLLQLLRNAYDLINPVSWLKGLVWVGYLRSLLDAHFQPTSPTPSPVIEMHLTNLPLLAFCRHHYVCDSREAIIPYLCPLFGSKAREYCRGRGNKIYVKCKCKCCLCAYEVGCRFSVLCLWYCKIT